MIDGNKDFVESDAPDAREAPLVLVVEDDIDILSFIALEFAEEYRVLKALDGVEGLESAREHIPDLVVTDLMMPCMNGVELCRELKTDPETSHIPVVMLTAKTSDENQLEGLEAGADDYVSKPFNIVLLLARVRNLLESRRLLREQFGRQFLAGENLPVLENTRDRDFLGQAQRVVSSQFSRWEFSAEEFAAGMGMSLRTLQRKLKAVSDQSPAGFINAFRMKRAAELLAVSDMNITEIGFEVGVDESSSFSRMFKKYSGMSPSSYRASRQA